jgi:hypothetical protein
MIRITVFIKKLFFSFKRKLLKSGNKFLFFNKLPKTKKILFGTLLVCFFIISYLIVSLFSINTNRLELAQFRKDVMLAGPCHEDCLLKRKLVEEKLGGSLKTDSKLENDIKKYFLENDGDINNVGFQKELLKIIVLAYGSNNPPEFILDYLTNQNSNPAIKAEIIRLFLASIPDKSLFDYYFLVLNSAEDKLVKEEALRTLSNLENKINVFKVEEIINLKELILSEDISLSLRSDILLFLGEYYPVFTEETKLALTEIYASTQEPIIKIFAADMLISFGYNEFLIPEASDAEWADYFNN